MVDVNILISIWFNLYINLENLVVGSLSSSWHSEKLNILPGITQLICCDVGLKPKVVLKVSVLFFAGCQTAWGVVQPPHLWCLQCSQLLDFDHLLSFIALIYTNSFSVGIMLIQIREHVLSFLLHCLECLTSRGKDLVFSTLVYHLASLSLSFSLFPLKAGVFICP